jgi:26S proteasome regulatory subunit N13
MDPEFDMRWNVPITSTAPQASTSAAAAQPGPSAYVLSNFPRPISELYYCVRPAPSGAANFAATPEQLAALSQILTSMSDRTEAPSTPGESYFCWFILAVLINNYRYLLLCRRVA